MNADRKRRVEALHEEALHQPAAQRTAWLDEIEPDADVRAAVRELLALEEQGIGGFLERPAFAGVREEPPAPYAEGELVVGPYRCLQQLGRGGQAVVYLAEDSRLPRRVALKLVPRRAASAADELRFRREAEAASRLDDPGICAIYEVGTDREHFYLAMRYVEGETLAERIRRVRETEGARGPLTISSAEASGTKTRAHGGALRGLLEFFERLARSLQRAHESGIVHRDVKPGNVMIDRDQRPVLLDFGLARDESQEGPTLTQSGDVFGTPAYMAPEQTLGQRADARTDVYALGACLFEALTLRRPFEEPTREALYRAIREQDASDLARAPWSLPKDVAIVVATALAKERDRRYQSCSDLAEDLRRLRESEPIRARPPSFALRWARFTRRHRAAVSGAFAVIVALSAGLAVALSLYFDAEDARELAEVRRSQAEVAKSQALAARGEADEQRLIAQDVNQFLVSVFASANPAENPYGRTLTAPEMLELAERSLQRSADLASPVRIAVAVTVGRASAVLGEKERAEQVFARALEDARAAEPMRATDLLTALQELAELHLTLGSLDAAEPYLLEAEALMRERPELEDEHAMRLASVRGLWHLTCGELALAETWYRTALDRHEELEEPEELAALELWNALAVCQMQQSAFDRAELSFAEAAALDARIGHESQRATLLTSRAALAWFRGDAPLAEARFREAASFLSEIYGPDHERTSLAWNGAAVALRTQGQLAEAREIYERLRESFERNPAIPPSQRGSLENNLARVYEDQGETAAARAGYLRAAEIYRKSFGDEYHDLLIAEHNLARLELYSGDLDAAAPLIEAVIERRRRILGEDHTELAESLVLGARLAARRGDPGTAEREFRAALAIYEAQFEANDKRVIDSRLGLVQSLVERADWQAAYEVGSETHARIAADPEEQPARSALAAALVRACEALGRREEAERWRASAR